MCGMNSKNFIYYLISGILGLGMAVYLVFLMNLLFSQISVVSRADLTNNQEVATFNLEKFKELKISQ